MAQNPETGEVVRVQTIDTLADGSPTPRKAAAAARIGGRPGGRARRLEALKPFRHTRTGLFNDPEPKTVRSLLGALGTASAAPHASTPFQIVAKPFRQRFSAVDEYLLGPEAMRAWKAGARLTIAVQSPPEFAIGGRGKGGGAAKRRFFPRACWGMVGVTIGSARGEERCLASH